MVVPHLRVAVRFPPTREGSGTKSTGRRPKNRASFRYPLRYLVRSWVLPYLFFGLFWDFGSLPAVTSASEVLTQAFVKFEVESYMFAYRIVLQNRTLSFLFPESGVIWR